MTLSNTKVYGIECPLCHEQIWSRHRHDCRPCSCGYCYIDGGRDYNRIGWGGATFEKEAKIHGSPGLVEIEVDDDILKSWAKREPKFPY